MTPEQGNLGMLTAKPELMTLLAKYEHPESSPEILETALVLFDAARSSGGEEEFRSFLLDNREECPRQNFLVKIWPLIEQTFPSESLRSSRIQTLYEAAEFLEFFRNTFPEPEHLGDTGEGNPCRLLRDMEVLEGIPEEKVASDIDGHPLYRTRIRELKRLLRYTHGLSELKAAFDKCQQLNLFPFDDTREYEDVLIVIQSLLDWHKTILSLSGAYRRHCEKCKDQGSCGIPQRFSLGGPAAQVTDNRQIPFEDQEKAGIGGAPALIARCRSQQQRIYEALSEFSVCLGTCSYDLDIEIDKIVSEAEVLSECLKVENESVLWHWYRNGIAPGLEDLTRFFGQVREVLRKTDSSLLVADSQRLQELGQSILKSLTLEQIYNEGHQAFSKFLNDYYTNEDASPANIRLAKARKSIRGARRKAQGQNTSLVSPPALSSNQNLPKLWQDLYADRYMNIPETLKERLFRQIVQALQDRLSLSAAAELLDTYLGHCRLSCEHVLSPPFLFIDFSFQALQKVWVVLLTALGLTIWLDAWPHFTAGMLVWLLLVATRLFAEARRESAELKKKGFEGYPSLTWNQLQPGFLVPMFLLLTPFALPDQMTKYVYEDLTDPVKLGIGLTIFSSFSLLAIWKIQRATEPLKNTLAVFGFLWPQAFIISFLVSMLLHQRDKIKQSASGMVLGVPWQVSLSGPPHEYFVYPVAALAFSVLCLFAAVFLEGLYRKK